MMMSTGLIGPLETAKLLFFGAYILATIGVIVGVIFEASQFCAKWQHRGWLLLVASLGADKFFTVLVFGTDGWISAIRRQEIVALETKLAPRTLTDDQVSRIVEVLLPFRGTKFDVAVSEGGDARRLIVRLVNMLGAAKWTLVTWSGPPAGEILNLAGGAKIAFMPLDGVHVWYDATHEKDFGPAVKLLVSALAKDGIPATSNGGKPLTNMSPDLIHLLVGDKEDVGAN